MDPFEKLAQAEITSTEQKAIGRLASNKDFAILADVLGRTVAKSAYDIIRTPRSTQDVDTVNVQGAHGFFRTMLKLVYRSNE